jgi:hypothetical protein
MSIHFASQFGELESGILQSEKNQISEGVGV